MSESTLQYSERSDSGVTYPAGFAAGSARAELKTTGDDVAVIVSLRPAACAGVFTTNVVRASCVMHSERVARSGTARAVVCNAGNANACNGPQGAADTAQMAKLTAEALGLTAYEVFVASTGVIGHPMPMEKLHAGIPAAAISARRGPDADACVAAAIMTTDLVPKQRAAECKSEHWTGAIRIGGVCKGSGMIGPTLGPPHATMLCFLTTDAAISASALQSALNRATAGSFNRITVDGDTSTNDMVLALANGATEVRIPDSGPGFDAFVQGLGLICLSLAKEVARDGEGATKLVEVKVCGAATEADAEQVGRTIALSPLVKTALFGNDPNWGRVLAAAGRAGVPFDPLRARVALGGICVYSGGCAVEFDEAEASAALKQKEVEVMVDLGDGSCEASIWTCDYSYDYIRINAEYHT